ncbi:MAG TPA: DUF4214 domain-containing protein [Acidimicrobiales bacterium]|nr:DUF4214 domain-containing protein [Acidimicrobiales bacterium]
MLTPVTCMRRVMLALLAAVLLSTAAVAAAPAASASPSTTAAATSTDVPAGVRDSVVRLYQATFDRAADADGVAYWLDLYRRGMPLTTIAEHFMTSAEWRARFGNVDDATFVDLLYRNVLGRPADRAGSDHWRGELARGYPRAALLVSFSESPELVERTGTAPPEAPAWWPLAPANSGAGRRIVYGNSAQRVWWIDQYNLVVDTYLVSGRAGVPNPGTYQVYSKSERAWAGHDGISMQWMVRFAHGSSLAIGFHSIPRYADGRPLQSESQLGTYRSSGCVRQADHKAYALYQWAHIGTTVVVLR